MTVSNLYWTLVEADDRYELERLADGQRLTRLTLIEVKALAAIADLAGGGPPSAGITSKMGIKETVEVKKYGKAKS